MALKRRSALQAAEKLVARGRLEAAVKQYRKVLQGSPSDTGTLNRLGDLYARLNRVPEAVEMFTSAADHFTKEGFFVKAIAIYKKIIRLDPTLIKVYETLADLYHRQGLVNEARAQYQVVADYYKQANNQTALVAVYEKMVELEPDNPSHRLKLAEFYCAAERIPDAMEQYQHIASFMLEHGKVDEAFKVYFGAFELKVEDLGFLTDVIVHLTDQGHEEVARRLLDQAIQRNPDAVRVAELVNLPTVQPVERRGAPEPGGLELDQPDTPTPPVERQVQESLDPPIEPAAGAVVRESLDPPIEPSAGEEPKIVLDLDSEPPVEAGLAASAAPAELAERGADLVDLSEVVSLDPVESEPSPAAAEPAAESGEAKDETGEFEIDLAELERDSQEAEPAEAEPVEAEPAEGEAAAKEEAPATGAPPAVDPATRADELVTEAGVLSNYGLADKSVELCQDALELVPGHVAAGRMLIELHQAAGRSEAIAELVERFSREGPIPKAMAELVAEIAHDAEGERPAEAEAEAESEPEPEPADAVPEASEPAAAEDTKLRWLEEESSVWTQADGDMFGEEEQFFDLAAELEQELTAEDVELGADVVPQIEEQSIEEIVEGFKQGVAETLSSEDYDTHYNLGIAYREMGLVDEAIGEFQLAAKSPQYLVDCCSLLGASFSEKGFPDLAVKWYERGLKAPSVTDEEKLGLLYELGNVQLASGDKETAKETFAEIYGVNSNYRDVVAKLEELRQA